MAGTLGINISPPTFANPEPEYFMLWLAVEALRAPLPAPWRLVRLEHDIPGEANPNPNPITLTRTLTLALTRTLTLTLTLTLTRTRTLTLTLTLTR